MALAQGRVPGGQHCARTLPDLFRLFVPYTPRVRGAEWPCYRAEPWPQNFSVNRELRPCCGRMDVMRRGSRAGRLEALAVPTDNVSSLRGERDARASARWCFLVEGNRIGYKEDHIASAGAWMRREQTRMNWPTDLPGSTRRVERI
jgi:hypothetical protein